MRTTQPRQGPILAASDRVLGLSIIRGVFLPTVGPFIAGVVALLSTLLMGPASVGIFFGFSVAVTVVPNIIAP
jgi:hypothetical protein